MRLRSLLILFVVIAALLPAWLFNRYMQRVIQPRRSFTQLLIYLAIIFAFVAGYTFLVVWIIMKLFPVPPPQA